MVANKKNPDLLAGVMISVVPFFSLFYRMDWIMNSTLRVRFLLVISKVAPIPYFTLVSSCGAHTKFI